jgi:hypothetical protein
MFIVAAYGFYASNRPKATPVVINDVLVNQTVDLQSGGNYSMRFSVPQSAINIEVSGNFTSAKGTVAVYVVTEVAFNSWTTTGSITDAIYRSGTSMSGVISTSLPSAGKYYLIYTNLADSQQNSLKTVAILRYYIF